METPILQGNLYSFSLHHSSLVPLVLYTQTGKILPQFHVVFDDWFTSVASVGGDEAFDPIHSQQLFATSHYQYVFDADDPVSLSDDWVNPELEQDQQELKQWTK